MTITVTSNKKNISASVHCNANGTIKVAGAAGVSDIAISDETITGATIKQIFVGNDGTGYCTITRGSEVVGIYDSTGWYDYSGNGMGLNINANADIEVTFTANGYCFMELHKIGKGTSEYLVG